VLLDPFSAFAIFLKDHDNPFVGHLVLGHGSSHGQSELAFLFKPEYRDIYYGTQAVTAILHGFVPHIMDRYLANQNNSRVDPSPLRSIHATGRFDDTFSRQAMLCSGMMINDEGVIWGALRFHYLITLDQIINQKRSDSQLLF
jgi:hypothetical protein